MFKNVASQQIVLLAIDTATNTPKTGDAANITAYLSKDYGAVTVLGDTTATEMDATNAPGLYRFDVTQTESNCDVAVFSGKSSTSGVRIVPVTVFMRPANATALSIDSSGRVDVIKVNGTSQTARDLGGQLDATISSRMATYTQPTGFLAATFPTTVASTTNITGGTITTVTNLTNAPTNGDFTATMKTSITTAVPTSAAISAQVQTDLGTGSALTALAPASTALSTAVWTATIAGRIDAAISTRLASASYTAPLDASGVRSAVGLASANLDTQLDALPTAAEISTQMQSDLGTGAALTSLASQSSVNTLTGYVDTEVAAILDAVSSSGVVLSAAQMNKIADHVHRRNMANVEASSSGDTLSLSSQYGTIQQAQESSLSGVTLTVKKTDGSTTLGTKTVTTSSSADPITGIS